jgi:hypothetical protein
MTAVESAAALQPVSLSEFFCVSRPNVSGRRQAGRKEEGSLHCSSNSETPERNIRKKVEALRFYTY